MTIVTTRIVGEEALIGTVVNAGVTTTGLTVYAQFRDAKTGDARTPQATTLLFGIDKDNERFEIVQADSHSTASGITTITLNASGRALPLYGTGGGGATGNVHDVGANISSLVLARPINELAAQVVAKSGDTMTGALDFSGASNSGVRVNNLTTVQRDALAAPANGMIIYNTTAGVLQVYDSGAWADIDTGTVTPNGDETTAGIWEGATTAEQGTATDTGATAAHLVPMNKNLVKASIGTADENKIAVISATGKFAGGFMTVVDGGDGSDGALHVSAGTTTLNLDQEYNYTTVDIDAGTTLAFTGSGDVAILKATGAVTIAGTIELRNTASGRNERIIEPGILVSSEASADFTPNAGGALVASVSGDGGEGGTSTTASATPGVGGAGGTGANGAGATGSGGDSTTGGGGGGGGAGAGADAVAGGAGGTTATTAGGQGGTGAANATANTATGGGGAGGGGFNTGNGGAGANGGNNTHASSFASTTGVGGAGGASGANGGNGGAGGSGGAVTGTITNGPVVTGAGGAGGAGHTTGGAGGNGGGIVNINNAGQVTTTGNGGAGGNAKYGTGGAGGNGGALTAWTAGTGVRAGSGGRGGDGRTGGAGGNGGAVPDATSIASGYGLGGDGGDGKGGASAFVLMALGNVTLAATAIINAQGGDGGVGGAATANGQASTLAIGGKGGDGGNGSDIYILTTGTVTDAGITINNAGGTGGAAGAPRIGSGIALSTYLTLLASSGKGINGKDGLDGKTVIKQVI